MNRSEPGFNGLRVAAFEIRYAKDSKLYEVPSDTLSDSGDRAKFLQNCPGCHRKQIITHLWIAEYDQFFEYKMYS